MKIHHLLIITMVLASTKVIGLGSGSKVLATNWQEIELTASDVHFVESFVTDYFGNKLEEYALTQQESVDAVGLERTKNDLLSNAYNVELVKIGKARRLMVLNIIRSIEWRGGDSWPIHQFVFSASGEGWNRLDDIEKILTGPKTVPYTDLDGDGVPEFKEPRYEKDAVIRVYPKIKELTTGSEQ